jgi:hypothetical protein
MADRKASSRVRATALRGYEARRRELTDVFNLPEGTREWVTVRFDPNAPDGQEPYTVNVCATAGRTSTVLPIDLEAHGELSRLLQKLLDENRGDLHHQLKLDLATNLMAQSAIRGDEE